MLVALPRLHLGLTERLPFCELVVTMWLGGNDGL